MVFSHHLNDPVTQHAHQSFVRLSVAETVGDALKRLQNTRIDGRIVYFYVFDEGDRLVGVIPTRRLLLNPPETRLADIMETRIMAIPATATLLDACEFFLLHRFLALPVVDQEGRMVGMLDVELYTDEISDLIRQQEGEDIFQLIGVRVAQVREASVPVAFRRRFPWLLCNIAGGLVCAALAAMFEPILHKAIVLAMFIPIVLALGESVSVQSLTLAVQIHEAGSEGWGAVFRRLRREAMIGLLLGLACGAIVGIAALAWKSVAAVLFVVLASITLSVTTAALFGLFTPVALRAMRRDPRIASGPMVLAMTDIMTLFYYFGLATLLLR